MLDISALLDQHVNVYHRDGDKLYYTGHVRGGAVMKLGNNDELYLIIEEDDTHKLTRLNFDSYQFLVEVAPETSETSI